MKLGEENKGKTLPIYEERWIGNKLDDWATILYTSGTTGQGKGSYFNSAPFLPVWMGYSYFNDVGHPLNGRSCFIFPAFITHI